MAPVACQVVLPVAVSPVMVSLAVARQAAWHLAICKSKAYLVVAAVPWARIPRGHKRNTALRVRPLCHHSAEANLDSMVDQKEEG